MIDFIGFTGVYTDLSQGFDNEPFVGFVSENKVILHVDMKHRGNETKTVTFEMDDWTYEELIERLENANPFSCGRIKVVLDETFYSVGELIDLYS